MLAFIGFDPLYFLFVMPAALLAMWAQHRVKAACSDGDRLAARSGLSGAAAARRILDRNDLRDVRVTESPGGDLSDHYDPTQRELRLSRRVYFGNSLTSVGIAAHEAGHALQHAAGFAPLYLRSALVPAAATGSRFSMGMFMVGMLIAFMFRSPIGQFLMLAGIALFSVVVLFQIVTLPVEFDASRRAKLVLVDYGIVDQQELEPVRRVLGAAALTYVAATAMALAQLAYLIIRSGLLGGRDR